MKEISLSRNQKTLVDDEIYEYLSNYKWQVSQYGHAQRNIKKPKRTTKAMHRTVWEYFNGSIPEGYQIDHIDRNRLNNQIKNLRLATLREQTLNRSTRKDSFTGLKGVNYRSSTGKYYSSIMAHGSSIFLGVFNCKIEAAKAYNQKAKELFGEYAVLNVV